MPYGIKRGVKAPGEYSFIDVMGLALAGSAGIIAALVTDYQQSKDASALYTINQWVVSASQLIGIGDVPLWVVIVGLILIGAGSVFYFQPITRQGAFAQGFGLLAVIMTAVPANLASSLMTSSSASLPALEPIAAVESETRGSGKIDSHLSRNAASPDEAQVFETAMLQDRAKRYEVTITINFPNGLAADVETMLRRDTLRGRLHNTDTKGTYNLFAGRVDRNGANELIVRAAVPARADSAEIRVRVESEKYTIEEQSAVAKVGEPLNWRIEMRPSNMPLWVQRANQSYSF